jgi:outer membrane protein
MMRRSALGATLAALLFVAPAAAQDSGASRLTLSDALDIAEGHNPGYRQASNSAALNSVEMRTIWLDQLLPRASVSLFNTGFTGNLQRVGQDNFGNPIQNPSADWNYFSNTSQQLGLTWALQGQSLLHAYKRQGLTGEDRALTETRALTELQVEVQRSYMDALEQRELLRAEAELGEARAIDLNVAERLFSLALRTRVDVLNAELAVEQQAFALQQQQTAYDRAVLALRTRLGNDEVGAIELVEESLPLFDPASLDPDALVRMALRVNPEIQQSAVAVRSSGLGVSESKNAWWPEVSMNLFVYRRSQQPRGSSLFNIGINEPLESQFQVQFSIPMFNNFFQNKLAMDRASVQLENDREVDRATRLRIEETVRVASLELTNQWESLRLAERSLEIAQEALRLAREEYRIGTRTFEDLRSSFDQEALTRRQVITSRHSFVDALLSLEVAVGERVRSAVVPSTRDVGAR